MKSLNKFVLPVLTGSAVLTAFFVVFFLKSPVTGQQSPIVENQNAAFENSAPKDQAKTISEPPETNESPVPLFDRERLVKKTSSARLSATSALAAASVNKSLKYDLTWNFGKKDQQGWYLYESLIRKMINVEAAAETPEFAVAVADWQAEKSISPTGILDKDTFGEMVKTWQSERLGSRGTYATEETLLTAPISDFYDSSRDPELLKVERETYDAYKKMIAAAAKDLSLNLKVTKDGTLLPDEKFLKIVSAFRSREYQQQLRLKSPNSGSAGLAVNSPHFTGQALDIYVGGEPVTTKDFNRAVQVQTPVYKWLVKNASKFGFYPYFYEPWHWEYVPERLRLNRRLPPNIPSDLPNQTQNP